MKINGVVNLKYLLKSVDTRSTLHYPTPNLTLNGILNVPLFMNSEHLDVISIPSHQNLINYTTEKNNYNSWVIPTAEQQ